MGGDSEPAGLHALHDTVDVSDAQWAALRAQLHGSQMLDVCMLAGWCHAISCTANAARVLLEAGAPRSVDCGRTALLALE